MPREQLRALAQDVNRLLTAGGVTAAGDERLVKRAAALRELGRQAPVLAQIADRIEAVTAAAPGQASARLLDLLLVVQQVRAGLAGPASNGTATAPLQPLPASGPWRTDAQSGDVAVMTESSTHPSPAQWHLLAEAAARGTVADLRLVSWLIHAFHRGSDDLAEFILERALPAFHRDAVVELWRRFHERDTSKAAWRFQALCRANPQLGAELCVWALKGDNLLMRQTAVSVLRQLGDQAAAVLPDLAAALGDQALPERAVFAEALGGMGLVALPAVPALGRALTDRSEAVRIAAAVALGRIGPRAGPAAVAALHQALKQEQEQRPREAFHRALAVVESRH